MAIEFSGRVYKSTIVLWMMGRGDLTLALIAALAVAYLIG